MSARRNRGWNKSGKGPEGLRIIGGRARATKLYTLDVPGLRPMLDRVREALFNILRNVTEGMQVLDLFSGSGSLGLEALSRGADSAVFVEGDRKLANLVERNIEKCHCEDRAEVLNCDAMTLPVRFPPPGWGPADIVLADPPYAMIDDPNDRGEFFRVLERMTDHWIAPGAIVVLHHRPMPHVLWPTDQFEVWDQRIYGQSQLTFFDAPGAEEEDNESEE